MDRRGLRTQINVRFVPTMPYVRLLAFEASSGLRLSAESTEDKERSWCQRKFSFSQLSQAITSLCAELSNSSFFAVNLRVLCRALFMPLTTKFCVYSSRFRSQRRKLSNAQVADPIKVFRELMRYFYTDIERVCCCSFCQFRRFWPKRQSQGHFPNVERVASAVYVLKLCQVHDSGRLADQDECHRSKLFSTISLFERQM